MMTESLPKVCMETGNQRPWTEINGMLRSGISCIGMMVHADSNDDESGRDGKIRPRTERNGMLEKGTYDEG